MTRSTGAALTVLDSLQILHALGDDAAVAPTDIIDAFEHIGIAGVSPDHASYLSMVGVVLRLLLRHANAEADSMFDGVARDLEVLGQDIERDQFRQIVANNTWL